MNRSFTYSALILRAKPSGESNRDLWFLCAEEGVLRATVFGGPKSKLRAQAAPYHRGCLWVYHDPVRDSRKVTDFDVQLWRPGIRELYERSAAAAAVAETILATHGGGGAWGTALGLADRALDALDQADIPGCSRILIHFLWNWADFLGLKPDLERCASCGARIKSGETLWYSRREGTLLCPSCTGLPPGGEQYPGIVPPDRAEFDPRLFLPAGPGCRRWLEAVCDLDPAALGRYSPDGSAFREARDLTTGIMAEALGKRLATWDNW
jgi:DNA repair protein RecO (recombination protein O)